MRFATKVLSEIETDFGYVIRREIWPGTEFTCDVPDDASDEVAEIAAAINGKHPPTEMVTCYTNRGDWIGDQETAEYLCKDRGIAPEHIKPQPRGALIPCSIGFCASEQKWYGWSHRAIYGFGVGSIVRRGDCGYRAPDRDAFGRQMVEFFCDKEWETAAGFTHTVSPDGVRGVLVTSTYTNKVPNESLRGTKYSLFRPYPKTWGRGEWAAETLDDARQMAIDFADAVS